jgi:hypothetical protein
MDHSLCFVKCLSFAIIHDFGSHNRLVIPKLAKISNYSTQKMGLLNVQKKIRGKKWNLAKASSHIVIM